MTKSSTRSHFEVSTSGRQDGTIEAVYIRLSRNKVAKTVEIQEDILLADYDSRGRLVGLELLAPVRISDLTRVVDEPARDSFRRFARTAVPRPFMVQTAH